MNQEIRDATSTHKMSIGNGREVRGGAKWGRVWLGAKDGAVLVAAEYANILNPPRPQSRDPGPCGLMPKIQIAQVQGDPEGSMGFSLGQGNKCSLIPRKVQAKYNMKYMSLLCECFWMGLFMNYFLFKSSI